MSGAQSSQVAVFDSEFNSLFSTAVYLKADVDRKIKLMKHPMEDGAQFSDFRIIEQVKIKLDVTLNATDYVDVYNAIVQVFTGLNLVSVQTKIGLFSNMAFTGIPHKEDVAHFDTIKLTFDFEEAQIVATSSSPLPQSAVTKSGGNINPTNATQTQSNTGTETTQQSSALYSLVYGK
jgi:hypothetical protein